MIVMIQEMFCIWQYLLVLVWLKPENVHILK